MTALCQGGLYAPHLIARTTLTRIMRDIWPCRPASGGCLPAITLATNTPPVQHRAVKVGHALATPVAASTASDTAVAAGGTGVGDDEGQQNVFAALCLQGCATYCNLAGCVTQWAGFLLTVRKEKGCSMEGCARDWNSYDERRWDRESRSPANMKGSYSTTAAHSSYTNTAHAIKKR